MPDPNPDVVGKGDGEAVKKTVRKGASTVQLDSEGEYKPPIKYVSLIADNPLKAMCGSCLCCFPLFIALNVMASAIAGGWYFSTDFPFYVKGHIKYLRQDALKECKHVANAVLPEFARNSTQFRARQSAQYVLKVMYIAPDGKDILDKKFITRIAEIENKIITASGKNTEKDTKSYDDYCSLVYIDPDNPKCKTPFSIIGFLHQPWIPLPYDIHAGGDIFKPVVVLNPADLKGNNKCTVTAARNSFSYKYKPADPFYELLGNYLPNDLSPDDFMELIQTGRSCEAGRKVMPSLTCAEWFKCAPMIANQVTMTLFWGLSTNKMWDYSNASAMYDASIAKFKDYWSNYMDPTQWPTVDYSGVSDGSEMKRGNFKPNVVGTLVTNDSDTQGRRMIVPRSQRSLLIGVLDTGFGLPPNFAKTGKAVISTFYFGSPLSNINPKWSEYPPKEQDDDQKGETAESTDAMDWMLDAYNDLLLDFYNEELKKDGEGLLMTWQGKDGDNNVLMNIYTKMILPQDMMYLLGAIVFVWGYIVFMKRSVFLATFAMIMIFWSAVPTLVLYQLVCQQEFVGILQMLSMFIIMGIGADDVFVLLDCYEGDRDFKHDLRLDLSIAWRHAAKAMLCTSSTTFFSFASNAISIFPAISTFGLWCSCLILVNYVSVNFYYMCVISVYDKYFARKEMICCMLRDKPQPQHNPEPSAADAEEMFKGANLFMAEKYYPVINKLKIPLVLLWVALFVLYIVFAAQLKPDPEPPQTFPDSDPYQKFNVEVVNNYGALFNPYLIETDIVLGINADDPIDRGDSKAVKVKDRGKVNWVSLYPDTDEEIIDFQRWIAGDNGLCETLRSKMGDSQLKIATVAEVNQDPVICPWTHFKQFVLEKGEDWPIPKRELLTKRVREHMKARYPSNPSIDNYEAMWKDMVYFEDNPNGWLDTRAIIIKVKLSVESRMAYEEGNKLADHWQDFIDQWIAKAPNYLKSGIMFTDSGAFHYFVLQETIIKECFQGIGISLALAYVVLLMATQNVVMATMAIASIGSIVCSVIAFTHWCGWKLGLMEAIIFVMVIGMSVDYVVHMADAYLEAHAEDRGGRTKFMLGKMGMSVLSGAITTLGSSAVMCLTYIQFFKKFGIIILWTIFQSVMTAMLFFTAFMALLGPQGNFGRIPCPSFRKSKGKSEG